MTPNHHPLPETLISFASAALPDATSAVIQCHLTMCRSCAEDARRLDALGGLLLECLKTGPAEEASTERALARWSIERMHPNIESDPQTATGTPLLPPVLRMSEELSWEAAAGGVRQHWFRLPNGAGQMRMVRLNPGESLHRGAQKGSAEITLVLQGVFSDETGEYLRGDIIEQTGDAEHELRAKGDVECFCLVATDVTASVAAAPHQILRDLRQMALPSGVPLRDMRSGAAALAASLALIAGIGLGWLMHVSPETSATADLVRSERTLLIAQGALKTVLDVLPSGEERTISSDGRALQLRIRMTFQDQSGDYCRQYQINASPAEQYSGIACRRGDEWAVKIQARIPSAFDASDATVPADAGANAAMDSVIGAWISGDPLVGADEAALRSKDWTK